MSTVCILVTKGVSSTVSAIGVGETSIVGMIVVGISDVGIGGGGVVIFGGVRGTFEITGNDVLGSSSTTFSNGDIVLYSSCQSSC